MIYLGKDPVGISIPENKIIIDTGIVYLDSATTNINVQHNLGNVPDFFEIYIDLKDGDLIPLGCCISTCGSIFKHINTSTTENEYYYVYIYRHQTSGNFLKGTYTLNPNESFKTSFSFPRGIQNWSAIDTEGNPMPYRWMVGRFV